MVAVVAFLFSMNVNAAPDPKGKKKAEDVEVWIVPGSKQVEAQAIKEGIDKSLACGQLCCTCIRFMVAWGWRWSPGSACY